MLDACLGEAVAGRRGVTVVRGVAAGVITAAFGFFALVDAPPPAVAQSSARFINACTKSMQRQAGSSDTTVIGASCRCLQQTLDAHGYTEQVRVANSMYVRRDGVEYYEFRGPRKTWTGGADMSAWRPVSRERESYHNAALACIQPADLPRRFLLVHDSVLQQSPAEARAARLAEFDAIVARAGLNPASAGRRYTLSWKTEETLVRFFPPRAIERKQSGMAVLRVTVDVNGVITQSEAVFEEPAGWGWGAAAVQAAQSGVLARPADGGGPAGQGVMLVRFTNRSE